LGRADEFFRGERAGIEGRFEGASFGVQGLQVDFQLFHLLLLFESAFALAFFFPFRGFGGGCALLLLLLAEEFLFFFFVFVLRVVAGKILDASVTLESENAIDNLVREETVVGDDEQAALKGTEILLQHVERENVQVVCRLVEDEEIGVAHQDGQQVEPPAFAPAELVDGGVL